MKKIVIFIYLCLIASIASARLPMPPEWQVISNIQGASLDVDGYSADLIKEKLLLVYRLKYPEVQKPPNLPEYEEKRYGVIIVCQAKTIKMFREIWYLNDKQVHIVDVEKPPFIPVESESPEFVLVNYLCKGK